MYNLAESEILDGVRTATKIKPTMNTVHGMTFTSPQFTSYFALILVLCIVKGTVVKKFGCKRIISLED